VWLHNNITYTHHSTINVPFCVSSSSHTTQVPVCLFGKRVTRNLVYTKIFVPDGVLAFALPVVLFLIFLKEVNRRFAYARMVNDRRRSHSLSKLSITSTFSNRGKIAKGDYWLCRVCVSIRPSAWNKSAHTEWTFIKFDICVFLESLSRKLECH